MRCDRMKSSHRAGENRVMRGMAWWHRTWGQSVVEGASDQLISPRFSLVRNGHGVERQGDQ